MKFICMSGPRSESNRRVQFQKSSQLFIRAHNETLSVVAMRVREQSANKQRTVFVRPFVFLEMLDRQTERCHARERCTIAVSLPFSGLFTEAQMALESSRIGG
jgi:hypothetical protein